MCSEHSRTYCHKDESLTHVPLFKNIFRTTMRELFDGEVPEVVIKRAHDAIRHMAEEEIIWTSYITEGMLGFSERSIRWFIEAQANSICRNLKIPNAYDLEIEDRDNPLRQFLLEKLTTESRGTLFDLQGTNYIASVQSSLI